MAQEGYDVAPRGCCTASSAHHKVLRSRLRSSAWTIALPHPMCPWRPKCVDDAKRNAVCTVHSVHWQCVRCWTVDRRRPAARQQRLPIALSRSSQAYRSPPVFTNCPGCVKRGMDGGTRLSRMLRQELWPRNHHIYVRMAPSSDTQFHVCPGAMAMGPGIEPLQTVHTISLSITTVT